MGGKAAFPERRPNIDRPAEVHHRVGGGLTQGLDNHSATMRMRERTAVRDSKNGSRGLHMNTVQPTADNFAMRHATAIAIGTVTLLMLLAAFSFWRQEEASTEARGWMIHTY